MRILHVWDQAGVAPTLAKFQRLLGHEAEVIIRKGFDPYGIEEFYATTQVDSSAVGFYRYALKKAEDFDIVHVHSLDKLISFIHKPLVVHFHGTDLRAKGPLERFFLEYLEKYKILVSTPDLLNLVPFAEWLHNPIDIEHFNPKKKGPLNAFHKPIPYAAMPDYLSSLSVYCENKAWFLSKTAYEALACGTTVNWQGLRITDFPKTHDPLAVAKRTIEIYEELLKK